MLEAVGQQLHLDVPRSSYQAFEQQGVVAERRDGDPPGAVERSGQVLRALDDGHALAATARRRLDQQRVPDAVGGVVVGDTVNDEPGITGTPAALTCSLARILSPMTSRALTPGPTNTTPAASHARARSAFSERKP